MKKIYFAGKFRKVDNAGYPLELVLKNDYRAELLGNAKLLAYCQDEVVVKSKFEYVGPFYCEKASNGIFTSTDCAEVLNAEYNLIQKCDVFVAVLGDDFSVGTIVELGWAVAAGKQIILLYQEEDSKYSIKSEYWFAIADAVKRSKNTIVLKYQDYAEVVKIIIKTLDGVIENEI